jgi:hypothetical protein
MKLSKELHFISALSALPTKIAIEFVPDDESIPSSARWTRRVVLSSFCGGYLFGIQPILFSEFE